MTPRIFIERPITSVEDAEGLPVGTVAVRIDTDAWTGRIAVKSADPDLDGARWSLEDEPSWFRDDQMVGFTALVPVEAEVRESEPLSGGRHLIEAQDGPAPMTAYVVEGDA